MRILVKLVLFFSLSFVILFLIATGMRFLVIRIEWVRTLSQQRVAVLFELLLAARWALSIGLYGGILLGLSYAVRNKIFAPGAILCIALLTAGFTYGISVSIKNWEKIPSAQIATPPLGGPGLILSNTVRPAGTSLVLLQGPAEPGGRRVVATPGESLLYQAEFTGRDQSFVSLPSAPFNDDTPWFLKSLAIDLRLNAEKLQRCLDEGLLPFFIYTGALIFLLSSLMFIFKITTWPLMNLLLGCLTFRGVLTLETFLNTPEIQDILNTFLKDYLHVSLAVPLIFLGIGLLVHLYSFLVYLTKRRSSYAA